jgi:SAM-dependent methyltransferase
MTRAEDCRCPVCGSSLDGARLPARDRWFGIAGDFEVRECTHCELGVTCPRVDEEDLPSYYPSQYDAWQPSRGIVGLIRHALARIRAALPPFGALKRRESGALLDVGCGRGDLAASFARAGWRTAGLDISPVAVAAARAVGVDASVGTIETVPWPDGSFDVIVMNHSLEHMADPVGALQRARELLRAGGTLVVAVPNWDSWQRRLFGTYWTPLDVPRHLTHFSPTALHRAARRAGFVRGRTRNYATGVGLPGSVWFWLSRASLVDGGQQAFLLVCAASYPLSWLVGRALGGDATYLVAEA